MTLAPRAIVIAACLFSVASYDTGLAQGVSYVATVNDLKTHDFSGNGAVILGGYGSAGDEGGGTLVNLGHLASECAPTPNFGTTFSDAAGNCFKRTTSNSGPKEWGAVGDGSTDDYLALQAWLNNRQLHVGDVGNYAVAMPLTCPSDTVIDGPSTAGSSRHMSFLITALPGPNWQPGDAVMTVLGRCRISNVRFDAGALTSVSAVPAAGKRAQ